MEKCKVCQEDLVFLNGKTTSVCRHAVRLILSAAEPPTEVEAEQKSNRFSAFNPDERRILRVLLNAHANTVGEIAVLSEIRVSNYLLMIEELEHEVISAE